MRVDGWVGEQIDRMIESFEISLREEQKWAYIANCVLEPSSNNGYSTQGTIYKIIILNRLARQSTLPGKKFDQIPLKRKPIRSFGNQL
jgi:hypothetical protein